VALVIGNGAYSNVPNLRNSANDARELAKVLRRLNFEVVEGIDLDQRDTLARLTDFVVKLDGAKIGLFYFAGHGLQIDERNYLLPVDAKFKQRAEVPYQTISLDDVVASMESASTARIILIDACRNNPLAQRLTKAANASRGLRAGQGLAQTVATSGSLIAFATAPGELADDGDSIHSPFTEALVRYLPQPGLEIRQVLSRVRSQVVDETAGMQVPWDSSSLLGDLYLVPLERTELRPEAIAPPAEKPLPEVIEAELPPERAPVRTRSLTAGTGMAGTEGSGLVNLSIAFAAGSAELSPAGRGQLDQLGAAIQHPVLRDRHFRVAGFTDARGNAEANKRLSEARADAVVNYLVERHGIAPDRLYAEGFGEEFPLDPTDPMSARNRRIEIRTWLPPEG
jgi:outer membrane protein OmpA-like peptidoglycan-associated protein